MNSPFTLLTTFCVGCLTGAAACLVVSSWSAPLPQSDTSTRSLAGSKPIVPAIHAGGSTSMPDTAHSEMTLPAETSSAPICSVRQVMDWLEKAAAGAVKMTNTVPWDWSIVAPMLAKQDAAKLLELALQLPAGQTAQTLCVEAFRSLASADGARAWQQLERLGQGDMEREATAAVLTEWAASDPAAAARAATAFEGVASDVLAQIAAQWVTRDPQHALQWAQRLPGEAGESALQETVRHTISRPGALTDTARLRELLAAASTPAARQQMTAAIASELVLQDKEKAFRWMATLSESERAGAMMEVASMAGLTDPAATANEMSRMLASMDASHVDAGRMTESITTLAEAYAQVSTVSAMEWAAHLPESFRAEAVRTAMLSWSERDPVSAATWLSKQSPAAVRDQAVLAFASQVAAVDAPTALQWLMTLPASSEQQAMIMAINQPSGSAPDAGDASRF